VRFFGRSSDRALAQLIADAKAAKDTGDLDRAQGLYRRASDLLFEQGRSEEAIGFFTNEREYGCAAEVAERALEFGRAAKLWFRGGDFVRAARARLKNGEEQAALDMLEEAKEFAEAARIAERRKNFARASMLYEKAGDKHLAANALAQLLRGDDIKTLPREEFTAIASKAARLYAESGQPDRAVKIARWAGQEDLALELLGRRDGEPRAPAAPANRPEEIIEGFAEAGDQFNAALGLVALARRGIPARYHSAIEHLFSVPRDSPDYIRAQSLLAEVFTEQGDRRSGLEVVERLLTGAPATLPYVPALYQKARILETDGRTAEALATYLAVANLDPAFRDAKARIAALEMVGRAPPPTPRPSSGISKAPISTLEGRKRRPGSNVPQIDLASDLMIQSPGSPKAPPPPAPSRVKSSAPQAQLASLRPSNLTGAVLRDRFRVDRRVGAGGQALVYLAQDRLLDRPVAIKVLNENLANDAEALERFLREARFAARVPHPKCLAIFDFGQERGITFMALEFFDGHTLKDRLKDGPLEPRLALRVARDVAEALGAAHGQGIIHRDVKPSNVMISQVQDVRLADFGVAENLGEEPKQRAAMVGSLAYMAPEQANGESVDGRADIFSLGVLMYEMLAGERPFDNSIEALARRMSAEPPMAPPTVRVGARTRAMLSRAMQADKRRRYPTIESLMGDLEIARREVEGSRGDEITLPPSEEEASEVTERVPSFNEEETTQDGDAWPTKLDAPRAPDRVKARSRPAIIEPAATPAPIDEEGRRFEQAFDQQFEDPTRTSNNVFDDETAIGTERASSPSPPRPKTKR
jgi:serine/threonine protein kinase/tetratricopeptide (TPR) repeat protein